MNSSTNIFNLNKLISEFIFVQSQLIEKFRQLFPKIKDLEYLSDCPRHGELEILGEKWDFQRDGIGICFKGQKSGKVIDAHTGIFSDKIALDLWQLVQYFESMGVKKIEYQGKVFDLEDENNIERIIYEERNKLKQVKKDQENGINGNKIVPNFQSAEAKALQRINSPIRDDEWIIVDDIGKEIDLDKVREEFYQSGYKSKISTQETSPR